MIPLPVIFAIFAGMVLAAVLVIIIMIPVARYLILLCSSCPAGLPSLVWSSISSAI
jgi:hypothetical protein